MEVALAIKKPPANAEDIRDACREDPLEKGMATPSSILAWRIQWIQEPGGLSSIGLQRVGHDWSYLAGKQAGGGRYI